MSRSRQPAKQSLELIEEAIHLIRAAPLSTIACYYLGALPFVLGLLYFWADMSRSPFASGHLAEAALAMAGLFAWMKFWQGVFASHLRARLAGNPQPVLSFLRCRRILFSQLVLQPAGLFILPLASVTILLFPWVYGFHQSATARADADTKGLLDSFKSCAREARLWPAQNVRLLATMTAFALYVFLNWTTVCFVLPGLVKVVLGIESAFTRSSGSMLNTTFFAAMFWLTYLCVDPIIKAAYTLRSFYGSSRQSGEDLKAELRQFSPLGGVATTMALIAIATALLPFSLPAKAVNGRSNAQMPVPSEPAAATAPETAPPKVSPPDLDRAIQETIQQRKYTWRAPRKKEAELDDGSSNGPISRFFERVQAMLGKWIRGFGNWIDRLMRKILGNRVQTAPKPSGYNWILLLQYLLWVLAAAVIAGIVVFLYRLVRDRQRRAAPIASQPIQTLPDLTDENLGADQLPEDGWTKLARELLGRGEFRLALRAFYLASLANLAGRNLITLARFKSNRDYERELNRRGHAFTDLLSLFGQNVSVFDRIWYGVHEINIDLVNQFAANVERIKGPQ